MKNIFYPSKHFFILCFIFFTACNTNGPEAIHILTGGIRHESNTFIPIHTTRDNFTVETGEEILRDKPWAGYLQKENVVIIPTLHAYASPFGVVEKKTYENFRDQVLEGVRKNPGIDGIFLDMHGALHVEGYEDAQVDLIRSIRKLAGNEVIISGSFDLHGNISEEFVRGLDILTAYRTAPHVDGAETRVRAVTLLLQAIRKDLDPATVHINVPIIIPGEKGITSVEPLKGLYEKLPAISRQQGILDASIFVGMPWTDVPRAGMSVQVVASDSNELSAAEEQAIRLARELWEKRDELQFDVPVDSIDEAIETAMEAPESTVFITDSGDNTTAGAAGDGTLVLERLLVHDVPDAVLAGIVDPEAVKACEKAGPGAEITLKVGGKIDTIFSKPLEISGKVLAIKGDEDQDPDRKQAIVQVDGVNLVLLSERRSFTSPEHFKQVGIDPLQHKIVVVKLGYLFQGLREIAPRTIMALTPGFAYQVVENLPYRNIRRPIYPLDPDMEWQPEIR